MFTLPFSLVRERVQPYRTADAQVPEDAARASLEQTLLQQLRETIGDDGAIISYETAAEAAGSVLTVTLTAECEQEIGPRTGDAGRGIFTASAADRGRDYSR